MSINRGLVNLRQQDDLLVGGEFFPIQLSEGSLNLLLSLASIVDARVEWDYDEEELDDDQWDGASEMLSLAVWELQTEVAMGGDAYVNRGDPGAWDFSEATLTRDGSWHDLDLSGIVTDADAVLVHLYYIARDNLTGMQFALRQKGNSGAYNISTIRTQAANVIIQMDGIVALDANRKIQYVSDAGMDALGIIIRGWWKPVS